VPPTPLEIVGSAYAALAAKDLDGFIAVCHPDAVLTQDPALPWGGRHVGPEGLTNFALALVGAIDSKVTPLAMFQADDTVVQYGRTAGKVRANGRAFDVPECHVWTVTDGLVSNVAFYIDSAAMLQALRP
jgi:ketosteroid isomerase-like protein